MTGTRVAVAGTFGPLHDGHRNLLRTALKYGDEGLIVGLTSDAFAQASRTRAVPPFERRRAALEAAIADLDEWGRDVEIRKLTDEHGIVSDEPEIDALVVSPETAPELAAINDGRRERGFEPIEGIVAPYVLAADGERISSTRIVRGEIDEHGHVRD
ncbi:phosphopantetheine adenylyltransferase [Halorientalis regularis]|uniref:Pantetheine-phosphate adenylyltransferase n=1 Tax=Halorientalis regularis TaxID=660518 RepID=A0A1G7J1A4_9EURY|nr:pantetheine-phosphate adenylyltransferase [Halorientalis regularis]SDF18700.1 pantetheine-phosphate adenylyltransferase [Halorientalis regularis]